MIPTLYMAIAIFFITYLLIITEKVHRTVLAIVGASLMVLLGVLSQEQAVEGIDFNTLGLLIGMMIMVGIAKQSGMFQFAAIWSAKVGRGNPITIFILLGIITAVFSAFLDNVTTVLLMVPIVFVIANNLEIHPMPFLIGTILLSNIGGTATLIGDPPNILIGSAANLSFNQFLMNLGPIAAIILIVTLGLLFLLYRTKLVVTPEARERIMKFQPREAISDKPLLIKSLIVFALVILGFVTHSATHIEAATLAFAGAGLLLLLTMNDPEVHLQEVEWVTIFFFTGLFILVTGLEHVGAIEFAAAKVIAWTNGNMSATTITILWGSAIASAVIDNIPFVATMIPLVKEIGEITGGDLNPLWWSLALGADIGGNATIIGASANMVVKGMAEKSGHHIGFIPYMKVALPLTFVALLLCTAYLYIRYI